MILPAFAASLAQSGDPRFRRVLWLGVALALALLYGMYAALLLVIQWFTPETLTLPVVGEVNGLAALLSIASLLVMGLLSVFLMVPVASAFTGLFLDDVADAVEARYYPDLPLVSPAGFWPALIDSLRYFVVLVALNLLGMILFVFSAGVGMVGLWIINGWLLSREYFTMVALRRTSPQGARALWTRHRSTLWVAGVLMAIPLSIPLINLLIPVFGAATFTHLYHRLVR